MAVVDMSSGQVKKRVIIDTGKGSCLTDEAKFFGDRIFLHDNHKRTLVFSDSGEKLARFFGYPRAISRDGKLILVEHSESHASLYDVSSHSELVKYDFPSGIAHAEFSPDGKRVYLVTVDQVVYTFDVGVKLAKAS